MTFVVKIAGSEYGMHAKQTFFLTFKLFSGSFFLGILSACFLLVSNKTKMIYFPSGWRRSNLQRRRLVEPAASRF